MRDLSAQYSLSPWRRGDYICRENCAADISNSRVIRAAECHLLEEGIAASADLNNVQSVRPGLSAIDGAAGLKAPTPALIKIPSCTCADTNAEKHSAQKERMPHSLSVWSKALRADKSMSRPRHLSSVYVLRCWKRSGGARDHRQASRVESRVFVLPLPLRRIKQANH
ncbi:hypothetical protein AAFF_G00074770 [Aldrovandia affinis]|uniref:Uncharacterized protein n=1 Tax=Aldrovandia affinis TaxID=143900 RepID=A0AAD7RYE1_9TELE|nr:hypothetical protein AAFF_G00074770 [Aldrovandia affinis]